MKESPQENSKSRANSSSLCELPDNAALTPELAASPFLKACRKEKTEYTPVWLMRQAGRYMKEFRDLRSKVGFLELCKNPELVCEVTVHAQETLAVDAAIIFADILLPLDAMGVGLSYLKGEGPHIERPFRNENDLAAIPDLNAAESLSYVMEAIKVTRAALAPDIPLIGFAACPFTLASYLIEGGGSRNFERTKTLMYSRPDLWEALMNKLVPFSIDYLNAQIAAGVQAIQLFDSWVGCLSPVDYKQYVLSQSQRLISGIYKSTPVIHFGTGTASLLSMMAEAGGDVIGLDWRVELQTAWASLGDVAVQGNLDPCILFGDRELIKKECARILRSAAGKNGHIFNLGHGVLPSTSPDNVKAMVEFVHTFNEN